VTDGRQDPRQVIHTQGLIPVEGVEGTVSAAEKVEVTAAIDDLRKRSNVGYGIGALAIAGALGLAIHSFCSLRTLSNEFLTTTTKVPFVPPSLEVLYVLIGGHAVITLAMVWLVYQLLRASERMTLPRHLSSNAEVARTLLGISSPQGEIIGMLKELIGVVGKVKDPTSK
jgi:hypothetical protein